MRYKLCNFCENRERDTPLRGEKPQNRPLSKFNTGRFALRAMLPVTKNTYKGSEMFTNGCLRRPISNGLLEFRHKLTMNVVKFRDVIKRVFDISHHR